MSPIRIALLAVNVLTLLALGAILVILKTTPVHVHVETLYTIPAAALIYEPSINEGCVADECCAH